jgi:hypothetical protein
MIEAVNSVLSSAPLLRQSAEQQSAARSNIAAPESVQAVVQAPYISPFVSVDVNFDTAVILLRDSETGDTVQQIPSEGRLVARRREESARQLRELQTQELGIATPQTSSKIETPSPATEPVEVDVQRGSRGSTASSSLPVIAPAPISQAVLSAFASGAQTANFSAASSFAISA